ncbi:MAG: THUMP domain-containing protein [bacterium]
MHAGKPFGKGTNPASGEEKILNFPVKFIYLESPVTYEFLAKTISGLENVLADELTSLGASEVKTLKRAASFRGDMQLMYRMNYLSRTALRILMPLLSFEVREQKDFYDRIHEFPWEDYLDPTKTLAVDAVISFTVFTNSQYVSQKAKDAIVDRLRDKFGSRPSVDLDNPDLRVNVHLYKNLCSLSLDSSGTTLNRRGYRKTTGLAPINEVLAAGLLKLSGWDEKTSLLDPMCGSATFLIEAAMAAKKIPAGFLRNEYGFMKWKNFDAELWRSVKGETDGQIVASGTVITGLDRSARAMAAAKENIAAAGLQNEITLEQDTFEESEPPFSEGFIIMNPPYDERLKLDDNIAFYKMIGNVLKRKYSGFQAWLISADLEAIKFIGLKPSKKITVFNGPLECRFVAFNLYEGKKVFNNKS